MGNIPGRLTGRYQSYDISTPNDIAPPIPPRRVNNYDSNTFSRTMNGNNGFNNSPKTNITSNGIFNNPNKEKSIHSSENKEFSRQSLAETSFNKIDNSNMRKNTSQDEVTDDDG